MEQRTNEQRKTLLEDLDARPSDGMSQWEIDFVSSVVEQTYEWTPKQIEVIDRILDEFLPF
jgi:hypothetical protein